ncbi:hypothetical protein LRS10_19945 [Phenylobacterium sp. J426]|uniref:hypothetical protein n=1 Tax=Phenylobacterium sp. J426 TaxID=2898439 RepID=UPI0021510608|nr:hypothetical protein [Phenylobacterium sp. J426]MCR5876214.1 hypothetical protein [Phenylobacterium sp. J426]
MSLFGFAVAASAETLKATTVCEIVAYELGSGDKIRSITVGEDALTGELKMGGWARFRCRSSAICKPPE